MTQHSHSNKIPTRRSVRLVLGGLTLALALGTTALAGPASASANRTGHSIERASDPQFRARVRGNRRVCDAPRAGKAACNARVLVDASGKAVTAAVPSFSGGYGPNEFHTAYHLPYYSPVQQTIAVVVAYDAPTVKPDLDNYDTAFGLGSFPTCTGAWSTWSTCFLKVNQSGYTSPLPAVNTGWASEAAMDVETVHATCLNCRVLLVEAKSNNTVDLAAANDLAARSGATVINNSWSGADVAAQYAYKNSFNHPGVAIVASTGDKGYGTQFPATLNTVVAVGGTSLRLNADHTWNNEYAWSGAGSGCTANVAAANWQSTSAASAGCGTERATADVSADADPNTGTWVYDSTKSVDGVGWYVMGGTSLAAPIISGIYGLAGNANKVNWPATWLYTYGRAHMYDIRSGSNGSCGGYSICQATTGYDGPTGMGSPYGLGAF